MKLPGLIQFRLCTLGDTELLEKVASQLNEMYTTGNIPSRHIPAQPNNDFDLLVAELVVRYAERKDIKI